MNVTVHLPHKPAHLARWVILHYNDYETWSAILVNHPSSVSVVAVSRSVIVSSVSWRPCCVWLGLSCASRIADDSACQDHGVLAVPVCGVFGWAVGVVVVLVFLVGAC